MKLFGEIFIYITSFVTAKVFLWKLHWVESTKVLPSESFPVYGIYPIIYISCPTTIWRFNDIITVLRNHNLFGKENFFNYICPFNCIEQLSHIQCHMTMYQYVCVWLSVCTVYPATYHIVQSITYWMIPWIYQVMFSGCHGNWTLWSYQCRHRHGSR